MESQNAWRRPLSRSVTCLLMPLLFITQLLPVWAAAGGITVHKSEASANFPKNITFLLNAEGGANIDQATLIYGVTTDTCFSSQARHVMEFEPSASVDLKWEWDLFRSGDLPPGVEVWWQWEIHAVDGSSLTTEVQKKNIEDTYFEWKKLQSGSISVYWASGSNAFGQTLLNIAVRSTKRLSELAGLTSTDGVRLYIYPSAEDMKNILAHTTEWMGGVAFPEYKIILIGIPTNQLVWAEQVIPHELAHLEMGMRTFNCQNQYVPSWLDEGMAEFTEGPVPDNERRMVKETLGKDNLQSLASIAEGFPADARRADLAYMQSRQVITFLIDTYGQEKLQALLDQLQAGENIDTGLRSVYGLDTSGIDQTWRASLGFGTAPEPSFATATPVKKNTAAPTMALMQSFVQASETPTAVPSPTITITATAAHATVTATADLPAQTDVPTAKESAGSSAASDTFPWIPAGAGAVIVLIVLVFLVVVPKIKPKK